MKLSVKCDWCGKEFIRDSASLKGKTHHFCSRQCLGKANGERLRKNKLCICDNCGNEFEYKGHHKKRNKHFFCCSECGYEYKVKKIYVNCDWCGKPVYRKRSDVKPNKHNFCDYGCYIDFINFENAGANNQLIAGELLYRRLAEMKMGRQLLESEEVHHIDGNHTNNSFDNLEVLTASEHSQIHASQKERDSLGRFVKKKQSS